MKYIKFKNIIFNKVNKFNNYLTSKFNLISILKNKFNKVNNYLIYKFNQINILKNKYDKISNLKKKFNQISFKKLANNRIVSIKLTSIKDDSKFETNSIKILYSLPVKSFTLIADKDNNIYLAKIIKFNEQSIDKNSKEYQAFSDQTNIKIRDNIYVSYDAFLNLKYEVKVNQKTLERVKNYFR